MIERFEKQYPMQEVLDFCTEHADKKDRRKRVDFDGHLMKVLSVRYQMFAEKGCDCVACGAKGAYFYKERHQSHKKAMYRPEASYHFNLYAIDADGEEVLMTKDHIIAHANGGSDSVQNMIPMCTVCNAEKKYMSPEEWNKLHPDVAPLPKGTLAPAKKQIRKPKKKKVRK